jgi:hypothetical protein
MVMTKLVLADERHPGCVIVERCRATARVRARMCARRLDRALAEGASPDSSAGLSVYAHDLIGVRARCTLSRSIRRLLAEALHPLRPLSFSVPVCRSKVLRSRRTLEELADRVAGDRPLNARGLAQLRLLLSDGVGPVYTSPGADDLAPALERASAALEVAAE